MTDSPQQISKPGTACLVCKRRKLKCSREPQGCVNCTKADLPCVYPTAETGAKRKRGPYKKKDPQAHFEHVKKYLANPVGSSSSHLRSQTPQGVAGYGQSCHATLDASKRTASEELVKDALIALTSTSVSDLELSESHSISACAASSVPRSPIQVSGQNDNGIINPPIRHVFELWHLYTTRVDPLTRLLHVPNFAPKMFELLEDPKPGTRQTLCHSVYFAAISSCSATEARRRFGERKEGLLRRYGQAIEAAIANFYGVPTMELMQAHLIYLVSVRREDHESGQWALFALALRNAELMGLTRDPGHRFLPYEAEMRRRLWWTICGLETRRGEESASKADSITISHTVNLPKNLDDRDLWHKGIEPQVERDGVTEMSFVLVRWTIQRMMHKLWAIRRALFKGEEAEQESKIRNEQIVEFRQCKERLQSQYLKYCHPSRAFDQMLLALVEVMMTKARLSIDYPTITKSMTPEQRKDMLRSSVIIIQYTNSLHTHERMSDWLWYFRGFVQWHSLAIVVAELGHSTNAQFAESAWAVLEPLLEVWSKVYESKRGDLSWDHVNSLISRSKTAADQAPNLNTGMSHQVPLPGFDTFSKAIPLRQAADSPASVSTGSISSAQPLPDCGLATQQQYGVNPHLPYAMANPAYSCTSAMANLDIDMNFDYFPEPIDFEALNAVFASPSWQMANPVGGFDLEMT